MSAVAADTLNLLEWRLARLEFYLSSSTTTTRADAPDDVVKRPSIAERLVDLENQFSSLRSSSNAIAAYLDLFRSFPYLSADDSNGHGQPAQTETSGQLQIVRASSAVYSQTATDLAAVRDNGLQEATPLTTFVSLLPRLDRAIAVQDAQAAEIQDLRERTAVSLAQWYETAVLEGGGQWAEWERMLLNAEQALRRAHVAQSGE